MASTIQELIANIPTYQFQPQLIQEDIIDHYKQVSGGQVQVVDVTGPFPALLETACVTTAGFMSQDDTLNRKQYARNAQNPQDLYYHMSDWDFINIFSRPSEASFDFFISLQEVEAKMVLDTTTGIYKLQFPRYSTITVAATVFTLLYPIEVRKLPSGGYQVVYLADQTTAIQSLESNLIDWEILTGVNLDGLKQDTLHFVVKLNQLKVTSTQAPVNGINQTTVNFTVADRFYFCRAFLSGVDNQGNKVWNETSVTFTPDVYDVTKPTVYIQVLGNQIIASLPSIYGRSGQIGTPILRCDFYESKGDITMDLGSYPQNAFAGNWKGLDATDSNIFTAPTPTLISIAMGGNPNDAITLNGGNGVDFLSLRDQVINNTTGPIQFPVTNVQIEKVLTDSGYQIVKNVDVITNRTFLASKPMPTPSNPNLITAAASSIETLITSMTALATLPSVVDNGPSLTITPDTLYKNVSGKIQVVQQGEIDALNALSVSQRAIAVNQRKYYYTPFHYVMDSTGIEFGFRPYYLDGPTAVSKSFVANNDTTGIFVSTGAFNVVRDKATGYKLQLVTASTDAYKNVPDAQVQVQLAFIPVGEQDYAYVNANLLGHDPQTNERSWEIPIITNFNINANDDMELTNFFMYTTDSKILKCDLTTTFQILYITTQPMDTKWRKSPIDDLLGRFLLPTGAVALTQETIKLHLGDSLTGLWSRARSVAGTIPYKTWAADQLATYATDVYGTPAVTVNPDGTVTYNILHHAGDPVLDANGNQTYAHRAGDVMLGPDGVPIPGGERDLLRQVDLMLIEGVYFFATDSVAAGYRQEMLKTILTWIINQIEPMNAQLLEQTRIYFYPQSTMGFINVVNDSGKTIQIEAAQTLNVNLYVPPTVDSNDDLKTQLETATIQTLSAQLANRTITRSGLINALIAVYGDDVLDVEVTGLGGTDLEIFSLLDDSDSCGIKKILIAQGDNTLYVKEAVTVTFIPFTVPNSNNTL